MVVIIIFCVDAVIDKYNGSVAKYRLTCFRCDKQKIDFFTEAIIICEQNISTIISEGSKILERETVFMFFINIFINSVVNCDFLSFEYDPQVFKRFNACHYWIKPGYLYGFRRNTFNSKVMWFSWYYGYNKNTNNF